MKIPLLFFLFFPLLSGCQLPKQEVVAVLKTHLYHTGQCAKVCMARTTLMTLEDVRALNLKPCPYCKPDDGL